MVMIFWWMLLVWLALGLCAVAVSFVRRKRAGRSSRATSTKNVAHAHRSLSRLESFPRVLRQYRWLTTVGTLCVGIAFIASLVLTLRPATMTIERPDLHNRDIMLCLDVSGSMKETDARLLATFAAVAKGLKGERVGLAIFNSSAATIIPLTDDYDFLSTQLNRYGAAMNSNDWSTTDVQSIMSATLQGEGASLIGDGLASCVMRFDNQDIKRSRSVILATDNEADGPQIMTFTQAAAFAKQKSVRIYGINPDDPSSIGETSTDATQYREGVLSTGGNYYKIDYDQSDDAGVVQGIVKNISDQEATRFKGAPQIVRSDMPTPFLVVLAIAAVGLVVTVGRLKL